MLDRSFVAFTEEMKKDYKILVPNMLPVHFKLLSRVFKTYGYDFELIEETGSDIAEIGLKYTHNDTCYPAILVIGQFMKALLSGKYDLNKTALVMFQTGGGCRASNYISLIRKALKKAGMEHIPVISFSFSGMEKHPGFKLPVKLMYSMVYAVLYGDLMMSMSNQIKPYEKNKGEAEKLVDKWTQKLGNELGIGGKIRYKKVLENYRKIALDFRNIPVSDKTAVKVGIVGEIFVKYSPLANNCLEQFLINEGAEPVVPGLADFCLYCVYNSVKQFELYEKKNIKYPIFKFVYNLLKRKRQDISDVMTENGFDGLTPFDEVVKMADGLINTAVKMGEGWLLTAEMMELANSGCKNIVCTQPFGCLPNHICGKGMMKPIKDVCPDVNIVAVDYDAGASKVNQENRLKLMLSNAIKKSAL
ncbi:MAG: 2-hydroxyacyl-CoA dehydratase [Clostridia bacterium]|nr:2-hydroxyacyl-CoA dehydratase [Clostridia bacterium]